MKRIIISIVTLTIVFSCINENSLQKNLKSGLSDYKALRQVNESFLEGYTIEKLAFFKMNDTLQQFVLKLNDNISKETVEKYSLGLHLFVDKSFLPKDKTFLVWDSKPELKEVGDYKYIIKDFNTPIKRIDSLAFFLYDRDGYKGMIGSIIKVKNIGL